LAGAFDTVPSPLFKAVLINGHREAAERMRDTARETYAELYRFERSWPEGLEILPANGGKGYALGRIKALTGAKRTIGIGDFENDVSLLTAADCGIAVANALPCVKQAADLVTVANGQHALRHVICEML
jgi:hydroxymethylpyrimidine pyrophosphatase-like HAD family hydrolase